MIGDAQVSAIRLASRALSDDEYRVGINTQVTCSAPSASTAMQAVSAESIPPDNPMITLWNPFLRT